MSLINLILVLSFLSLVEASNWDTYPLVSKTASINGFADPIYDKLPSCAKSCVEFGTGNTPCPYWDTGCFCVMPQWSGEVAECFASACSGTDVDSATSLAISLCSSVGANTWMIPASASTAIIKAEATSGSGSSSSVSLVTARSTASASKSSSSSSAAVTASTHTTSHISSTASAAAAGSNSTTSSGPTSSTSSENGAAIVSSSLFAIVFLLSASVF